MREVQGRTSRARSIRCHAGGAAAVLR